MQGRSGLLSRLERYILFSIVLITRQPRVVSRLYYLNVHTILNLLLQLSEFSPQRPNLPPLAVIVS